MTDLRHPPGLSTWQVLVAHDLKNALGDLESRLERLAVDPDPDLARDAHRRCRELRRRLVMLLTVQRGEADGALPCWPTDEDPVDLLGAAAREAAETLAAGGQADAAPAVAVELEVTAAPPFWTYDPRLVRLAIDAALDNATRFARTRVALRASVEDGCLVLEVLDDGPGPGTTLASPDAVHGTGLGTELARAVAHAHVVGDRTGDVRLDDAGLPRADGGLGGRFRLRLP